MDHQGRDRNGGTTAGMKMKAASVAPSVVESSFKHKRHENRVFNQIR